MCIEKSTAWHHNRRTARRSASRSYKSKRMRVLSVMHFCSALFFSYPRSEVGHTMSVLCLFIFVLCHCDWLFHGKTCPHVDVYPAIQAVRGLIVCVHLALFRVSSCSEHSMLVSLLWQFLIVSLLLQLCWGPTHLFSLLSTKLAVSYSNRSSRRR